MQYNTKYCPNPTSRDGQRHSLAYTYTGVAAPHPPSTHRGWNLYSDSHPPPEDCHLRTPIAKSQGRLSRNHIQNSLCSALTGPTISSNLLKHHGHDGGPSTGIAPPRRILSPKPQPANSFMEKFSIPCPIKRKAENRESSFSKYLVWHKRTVLALVKPNLFLRYKILPPDTVMLCGNRLYLHWVLTENVRDRCILRTRVYTNRWSHASHRA